MGGGEGRRGGVFCAQIKWVLLADGHARPCPASMNGPTVNRQSPELARSPEHPDTNRPRSETRHDCTKTEEGRLWLLSLAACRVAPHKFGQRHLDCLYNFHLVTFQNCADQREDEGVQWVTSGPSEPHGSTIDAAPLQTCGSCLVPRLGPLINTLKS